MARSIAALIAERTRGDPDRSAYVFGGKTVTWAQYEARSEQCARYLVRLGFQPGERLAVLLPNGPGVHIAWVAAEKGGLVIVAISDRTGFRELEHALRLTGASGLISRAEHLGRSISDFLGELRERGFALRHHLTVEGELAEHEPIVLDGMSVDTGLQGVSVPPQRHLAADDLFLLNFTSGTTGLPKCVQHDQKRWMSFHRFAADAGHLTASDVFMSIVPTPYGFGIWSSHVTPTLLGVPTVLMPRFAVDEAIGLIEEHRVTVLSAVTTQFLMMLNSPAMERHDLASLRVLFTGGEPVPYDRAAEFEERTGSRVLQFYGSNEVGAVSRTTLSDPPDKRLRTAGRVISEMNVRLFDENGNDVTESGRGQPGCKGPTLSGGYYGDAEANAKLIREDGSMMLGDVVEIDDQGYLRVIGRTDDFIIRGGRNISAAGVEQQVCTHPAVALAAAVPMPDEVYGERVCVYVELHPGASLDLDSLTAHLASRHVSKETWPERLVIVPELPKNAGGKIAKKELRDDIARQIVRPPTRRRRGR